jgi:Pyruvate/2-oxoacid:ferredoxin oxidoreductase gamma subunit/Pyruvate/2-oxoacid:ferredoxin oxidoreductase delta subunit
VRFTGGLLARAAAEEGRVVTESSRFGAAAKRGDVLSHVQIGSAAIDYPFIEVPDCLLVSSQTAYDRCAARLPASSLIIYDASLVAHERRDGVTQIGVPAAEWMIARFGDERGAGLVLLGAMTGATRLVGVEVLKRHAAVRSVRQTEVNIQALEEGMRLLSDACEATVRRRSIPCVVVDPAKCEMARPPEASAEETSRSVSSPGQICRICELICPTLAITHQPETQEVVIDAAHCNACGLCQHFCPREALTLRFESETG